MDTEPPQQMISNKKDKLKFAQAGIGSSQLTWKGDEVPAIVTKLKMHCSIFTVSTNI